jgi:predicted DNA-binding transcriptional regulator YafY
MTRSERLYALVEYLRSRRATRVNVAQLAERFGVSERTIFRDLASLRGEYVPIDAEPGPGGGLRLGRDYSMPPINFTVNEGASLWLSVAMAMRHHRFPWRPTLQAVLDKVTGAMASEEQRRMWLLVSRLVVLPPADRELTTGAGPLASDVFEACRQAFERGRRLAFGYTDRDGRQSERLVEPHGLMVAEPLWYVLARDVEKDVPRSFRLDRMRTPRLLEDESFQPTDPRPLFPDWASRERTASQGP